MSVSVSASWNASCTTRECVNDGTPAPFPSENPSTSASPQGRHGHDPEQGRPGWISGQRTQLPAVTDCSGDKPHSEIIVNSAYAGQGRRSLWNMGDMSPNIYEGGHPWPCPPNILEVMSFRMSTRVTATVVCCILTQILCVVSQKASASDPLLGLCPWTLRSPDPQSFFMSPNNPVRSTP